MVTCVLTVEALFVIGLGVCGASLVAQMVKTACSAGDLGLIPGLGRSPGGGHGNPLRYSCLENLMDRGAWWASVHGVAQNRTRLSTARMKCSWLFPLDTPAPQ